MQRRRVASSTIHLFHVHVIAALGYIIALHDDLHRYISNAMIMHRFIEVMGLLNIVQSHHVPSVDTLWWPWIERLM